MAETQTRPTPTPWTLREDDTFSTLGDKRIVAENLISPGIVFGGLGAETDANAALIVAACNACQQINPMNPIAVAEAIPVLVAAAKDLQFLMTDGAADFSIQAKELWAQMRAGDMIEKFRAALASIETQETR